MEASTSLLQDLNAAQAEAVQAEDGPILIFAGAGSGKTRVLTRRIAWLMLERDIPGDNILAVTFTNKAAREMKARLRSLVHGAADSVSAGTFHAICARILRREIHHAGYGHNFAIYDDDDQLLLVKQALKALDFDEKHYQPRSLLGAISAAKNELRSPEQFRRLADTRFEDAAASVYVKYQELLSANNAVDFDDLISITLHILTDTPSVLSWYQRKWHYILVDEFQDTNKPQYQLVKLLAQAHRNVLVVGDDDQSIYSWRGADVRNILSFTKDFPDARVLKLEQNYRSTQRILAAAHGVVEKNETRAPKRLWTANDNGAKIIVFEAYNEQEEADYVVRELRRLVARGVCRPGECAIMYRMNAQSRILEEACMRQAVKYRLVGGTRFHDRKEVRDVVAYLRLLHNPFDGVSLERVLNVPPRGIGPRSVSALQFAAAAAQVSLRTMLRRVGEVQMAGAGARKSMEQFSKLLDELSESAARIRVEDLFDTVLERTGYASFVRDGSPEGEERWQNVMELRTVVHDFGELDPGTGLDAFLQQVALVSDQDTLTDEQDAVTLITLHAAKGLEFPVVFIVGLEEGLFPHSRSLDEARRLEEERRLAYVGMTRAMRLLYLTHTYRRTIFGSQTMPIPSRFLEDVPKDVVSASSHRQGTGFSGRTLPAASPNIAGVRNTLPSLVPGAAQRRTLEPSHERVQAPFVPIYHAGDKVYHKLFGDGIVVRTDVKNDNEEVTVAFSDVGVKKLSAELAPMEVR
jgi:DNA helicase-2/ATP-dependent DNA helicase PcrA